MDNWLPVDDREKASDEIARHAIVGREAHHAITRANVRMTGAVQCNEKAVVQNRIAMFEVLETKWRAVRGEGCVSRRNLLARIQWRRRVAKRRIRIGNVRMSSTRA